MKIAIVVTFALLAGVLMLFLYGGRLAPPPVADQPPEVLRRLELRIADLDKTHSVVGGERYRVFECREVPR